MLKSEHGKVKRLVEEKESFKNRKLKSRKTGNARVLPRLGLNGNSAGSKATLETLAQRSSDTAERR